MTDKCEDCRFWEHDPGIRGSNKWGACKRFPPQTVRTESEYAFVETPADEWCGEFDRRPTSTEGGE